MKTWFWLVVPIALLCVLFGCGGGGGGSTFFASLKFSVDWGLRSRSLDGPGSALSVVLRVEGASESGSDLLYPANRSADPSSHSETYTTGIKAKVGAHRVTATFFAQGNGTGSVVGVASGTLSVQPDGTLSGSISTVGTVSSVSVPAGQSVGIDQTKQLQFSAKDSGGGIVAVSGGSAVWTVTSGSDKLAFQDGYAKGRALGSASVIATVDGVASAPATVAVTVDSAISVEINPLSALVQPADSKQFTATVYGTANQQVTWSVLTANGGSISSGGLYTAPPELMYVTIEARSAADPSKTATALVIVQMETLEVDVSPNPVTVGPNGQQQFSAFVIGSPNQAVTWKVLTAGGGSIDANGLYTAPATPMAVTVEARAVADPAVAGTSKVTVQSGTLTVTVSPNPVTLEQDASEHFTAVVEGSPNQEVTWSVEEEGGGSISAQGNYRAPQTLGTYTVRATSKADPNASGTAAVTVIVEARIVFWSKPETVGPRTIFTIKPDGTDRRTLGDGGDSDEIWPVYSPNGSKILFSYDYSLWTMAPDGSNRVHLNPAALTSPSWSPDGRKIVCHGLGVGGYMDLYILDSDGSNLVNITNNSGQDWHPAWSPDGSWIAYVHDSDVWLISPQTGQTKRLTTIGNCAFRPSWSPDGAKIAFDSEAGGTRRVYLMNSDGSGLTVLKNGFEPAFSPDGRRIAFCQTLWDISVMDADGSNVRTVAGGGKFNYQPSWRTR
ncbi:MAG: PD40 domain-containing protein [Armatimonadetes bacterium]|nr:PD40 domain-containing protein [Armatimonadota bacterium]